MNLHVTWPHIGHRVFSKLRLYGRRFRAQWLGTELSDADFLQALDTRFTSVSKLLAHLATRDAPRFFIDPEERGELITAVRVCSPDAEAYTISAADQVCEHVFQLLGSDPTYLGKPIQWHVDFKSNHRWDAKQYYADVRPAGYPGGYDIKVPWELNRCHHLVWLGQAYWYTSDEKYAQEFVAQVTDWIEHNPLEFGVNWACTMDVAIRAVNWLWSYHFFKGSPSLDDDLLLRFLKSLLAHGRHIIQNLEKSGDFANNHYLSDLVGLVYLGILCPEFKDAAEWREVGLSELWNEMLKQIYPDGVDFEGSTAYHRLAAELFLSPIILCQLNGIPVPAQVMTLLEKMLEFVKYYTKPDGTVPLIGDSDNGRLLRLQTWRDPEREWIDHRYLLALGAVLFERDDLAQAAGDRWEEALWLLGERAVRFKGSLDQKHLPPIRSESRSFPDGGYYILRHEDMYIILSAGANRGHGDVSHAHDDALSFEFYADGITWIVDPGTYVYTGDCDARNLFRSAVYHNAAIIGHQKQRPRGDADLWRSPRQVASVVHRWESTRDYQFLDASVDIPLAHTTVYDRIVYLSKRHRGCLIRDLLVGSGVHCIELRLHFSPSVQLTNKGVQLHAQDLASSRSLAIVPLPEQDARLSIETGFFSPSYGIKIESPIARYTARSEMPCELAFVLVPYRRLEGAIEVVSMAASKIYGETKSLSSYWSTFEGGSPPCLHA